MVDFYALEKKRLKIFPLIPAKKGRSSRTFSKRPGFLFLSSNLSRARGRGRVRRLVVSRVVSSRASERVSERGRRRRETMRIGGSF